MSAAAGTLLLTNVRIPLSKARSCGGVPVPSARVVTSRRRVPPLAVFHRSFATAGGRAASCLKHQPHSRLSRPWLHQHSVRGAASASRNMTSGHAPWGVCAASTSGTPVCRPFNHDCCRHLPPDCCRRRVLAALPSSPWATHSPRSNAVVLRRSDTVMTCPLKVCAVAVMCDWYRDRGASLNFEDQNF